MFLFIGGVGVKVDEFLSHMLASCGDTGDKNLDPRTVIEKCCEVGSYLNAYSVLLYLVNGRVGMPRIYPIPPAFVPNIKDICLVNPETLIKCGIELLGIPTPQTFSVMVVSRRGDDEEGEKEESPYEVVIPSMFGVNVVYSDMDGNFHNLVMVLIYSKSAGEYVVLFPPDNIRSAIINVCRSGVQESVLSMSKEEVDKLQSQSSLIVVKKHQKVKKEKPAEDEPILNDDQI